MELNQNIAFPLEVFCEIYKYCIPQTIYAFSCTCSELNEIAGKYFKLFAILKHMENFAPSLDLIETDYWIQECDINPADYDYDTDFSLSIRYDEVNSRSVGYRHSFIQKGSKINEILAIVSSREIKFTAELVEDNNQYRPSNIFSNKKIKVVKYKRSAPVDPKDIDFRCGAINHLYGDHISITD
ncbi:hypothetical protein PV-S19_0121 [Pacmanvirus S19]|nr:hypothetical protein PV-S19_0121 [Pacmanvirus S19]